MNKNELLELLNEIEGNPEIIIWNGHVGDYQHIESISPHVLVKPTIKEWTFRLECERIVDTGDRNYKLSEEELKEWQEMLDEKDWELETNVAYEDIKDGRYVEKPVYIIEPAKRGVHTFDRLGAIEY